MSCTSLTSRPAQQLGGSWISGAPLRSCRRMKPKIGITPQTRRKFGCSPSRYYIVSFFVRLSSQSSNHIGALSDHFLCPRVRWAQFSVPSKRSVYADRSYADSLVTGKDDSASTSQGGWLSKRQFTSPVLRKIPDHTGKVPHGFMFLRSIGCLRP